MRKKMENSVGKCLSVHFNGGLDRVVPTYTWNTTLTDCLVRVDIVTAKESVSSVLRYMLVVTVSSQLLVVYFPTKHFLLRANCVTEQPKILLRHVFRGNTLSIEKSGDPTTTRKIVSARRYPAKLVIFTKL